MCLYISINIENIKYDTMVQYLHKSATSMQALLPSTVIIYHKVAIVNLIHII